MDANKTTAVQLSVRAASAAGLAVGVAQLLNFQFPLYAMIAAILVTDLSPVRTRELGIPRFAGTVLGAALGALGSMAFGNLPHIGPLVIALGVVTAMLLSHLFRMTSSAKIAGYVCGVVLLNHIVDPWSYALFRVIETSLGIAAAIIVSFIPKLMTVEN